MKFHDVLAMTRQAIAILAVVALIAALAKANGFASLRMSTMELLAFAGAAALVGR